MSASGVDDGIELPCGERVTPDAFDMGMREFDCSCGEPHAVVTDAHPLGRFVPEAMVETLREAVDTDDEFERFGTPHIMGMVLEEAPDAVASADRSDDGTVGYALLWVSEFDARRLHELVVELVVELMDHAVSHTEDDAAVEEFQRQLERFDVEASVAQARDHRVGDDGQARRRRDVKEEDVLQ